MAVRIGVQITTEPIVVERRPTVGEDVGAWTEFCGLVRGEEEGRPIKGLEYEAYGGMAEQEIRRLLEELGAVHPCLAVTVVHRVGVVPVGEAAIYVGVAARHRAEGFALVAGFMDRLKQDVPIWKRRVWWREGRGE